MKTLYAVGCSFTRFSREVEDKNLWPSRLAKMVNARVINDAKPGGSNQRSFRKLLNFLRETEVSYEDLFVIIQITHPLRFEFQKNKKSGWVRVVMNNTETKASRPFVTDEEKTKKNLEKIGRQKLDARLLNYFDTTEFLDFVSQISAICFLLEKHNIDYRLISLHNPMQDKINTIYLNNLFNWLVPNNMNGSLIQNMFEDSTSSAHPSAKGHRQIAEFLYNHVSTNF